VQPAEPSYICHLPAPAPSGPERGRCQIPKLSNINKIGIIRNITSRGKVRQLGILGITRNITPKVKNVNYKY
jgi:hypothetical protein